jgi:hypothetical protein
MDVVLSYNDVTCTCKDELIINSELQNCKVRPKFQTISIINIYMLVIHAMSAKKPIKIRYIYCIDFNHSLKQTQALSFLLYAPGSLYLD